MKIYYKESEISSREILEHAIELAKTSNGEYQVSEYVSEILGAIMLLELYDKTTNERGEQMNEDLKKLFEVIKEIRK